MKYGAEAFPLNIRCWMFDVGCSAVSSVSPLESRDRFDYSIQSLLPKLRRDVNRRGQANHLLGRQVDQHALGQTSIDDLLRLEIQLDAEHKAAAADFDELAGDL